MEKKKFVKFLAGFLILVIIPVAFILVLIMFWLERSSPEVVFFVLKISLFTNAMLIGFAIAQRRNERKEKKKQDSEP
ncbi:MAG: hypothetical protein FWE10_08820 [Rikenellaceae bacterium]|nr:hypothetical protein [Rikenellaceae bacterium]MCL2692352.1 hypothetical protein [Rikenellaceae bacterium]